MDSISRSCIRNTLKYQRGSWHWQFWWILEQALTSQHKVRHSLQYQSLIKGSSFCFEQLMKKTAASKLLTVRKIMKKSKHVDRFNAIQYIAEGMVFNWVSFKSLIGRFHYRGAITFEIDILNRDSVLHNNQRACFILTKRTSALWKHFFGLSQIHCDN